MNLPCILIPVLVGLICGLLGYLLGKLNSKKDDSLELSLQADLDACKANTRSLNTKIASLEAELAAKATVTPSSQSFTATPPVSLFDGAIASTVLGKKIKENDLKIVEGIGPKIEALLNDSGISTWCELSQTSTEKLQSVLDSGGEN
jgi:predicted flap endonuclease-1-like 5' DNA nuclease